MSESMKTKRPERKELGGHGRGGTGILPVWTHATERSYRTGLRYNGEVDTSIERLPLFGARGPPLSPVNRVTPNTPRIFGIMRRCGIEDVVHATYRRSLPCENTST